MQNILSACVTTGLDLWDHLMDRTNQSVSNDQYDGERQMRGQTKKNESKKRKNESEEFL